MAEPYKLTATPFLLLEGEDKGHLETVTFIATSEHDTQKWWSVNVGSYETDFSKLVHSSAAKEIVNRLRSGETVEFPGRYELSQLKGFGGSWGDRPMCGRYYRRSDKQRIAEAFKVGKLPPGFELPPDYNIAPSTYQPIIRADAETGERVLVQMRWGLIPAKIADPDSFKIYTTSNSRAESILDKPIWKGPFQHSRCLIPVDGFYEWLQRPSLPQPPPIEPGEHGLFGDLPAPPKKSPKQKAGSRPVYKFEMPDGEPYALAGLFSEWRPRRGDLHPPLDTFSIVTTEANELMEPIHNRMPVILHSRDFDRWLNDYDESRPPLDLLRPFESDKMRMTPANRLVGNVRNNGPEMLNSA